MFPPPRCLWARGQVYATFPTHSSGFLVLTRATATQSLTHLSLGLWKSLANPFEDLCVFGDVATAWSSAAGGGDSPVAVVAGGGAELGGQEEREVVEDESAVL